MFASVTHCSQFKICIYFFTKHKLKLLFIFTHRAVFPHLPVSSDEFSQACPFLTYPHLPLLCLYLISKTYTAILSEHKYRAPHLMHSLKTSKMESLSPLSSSSAADNTILAESGLTEKTLLKALWPLSWTFLKTLLVYGQHKKELHFQAGGLK